MGTEASRSGLIFSNMTLNKRTKGFLLLAFFLFLLLGGACGSESEEAFFQKANAHFLKGSPEKAIQVYRDYRDRFPQGRFRDAALLREGEILYYVLGKKVASVEVFGQLALSFPNTRCGLRAREILAGMYRDESADYMRAVVEYQWLLTHCPNSSKADEYHYQIAHCLFFANKFDQAISEYKRFIESYPESRFIERAYDELGSAYVVLRKPETALSVFKTAIEKFPESSLRPTFEFKVAECYEVMDLLDKALAQYQHVRKMYDNWPAVDIRIKGVESRLKEKQGPARYKVKKRRPRAAGRR